MRNFFRRSRRVSDRGRRVRPQLEALEDRTLLSNPATTGDLINAIVAANSAPAGTATTITLAPGATFDFTSANNSTDGANALPVITANITIVGNGDTIERTGTAPFRLFDVASGASLTLKNLTLQNGLAFGSSNVAQGGAIFNQGTVTLSHDVISDNEAKGDTGQTASGGGIANVSIVINNVNYAANLTIEDSIITDNTAVGGATGTGNGGVGQGGGLYNGPGSTMIVTADLITDNHAVGGDATGTTGTGGRGFGGGIDSEGTNTLAASLTVSKSALIGNQAKGGAGHPGGAAMGGGIQSVNPTPTAANPIVIPSKLTVSDSTFTDNEAVGGGGGGFSFGGAIRNGFSDLRVTGSSFTDNLAQGGSGGIGGLQPGAVYGGAISCTFIPNLTTGEVASSIFRNNQAVGGNDNIGGNFLLPGTLDTNNTITDPGLAAGGAILLGAGNLEVSDSAFTGNQAIGGDRNTGGTAKYSFVGSGNGGAIFVLLNVGTLPGSVTINNSTFINNQAKGGTGNLPGTGENTFVSYATAGAIGSNFGGNLDVRYSTLVNNQAIGGAGADGQDGGDGLGGGIADRFDKLLFAGGSLTMSHDALFYNQAVGGVGSAGHNGGNGLGGGLYNDSNNAMIFGSSFLLNLALGGTGGSDGGNGGGGLGGGLFNAGALTLMDSLIAFNTAKGGAAGSGGGSAGTGSGGGVYNAAGATISIDLLTLIFGNKPNNRVIF